MDFINGITLLLIYELVGEACTLLLRLPIPGPVLGMMFLFLTLMWRRQIPSSLNLASETLLGHLSLLFVPAGVGVMIHFERILQESMAISLTLLLSTIITMTVTATIMEVTQRLLS
ncbi:CidA/LrgA family protein [Acaryochloris sp. IP29b_bin.148]|uniref:CidA/LrgA family protein n=1 Tax=Acaryochloris sp. IP29b_bin.148 TaxID=2969218 RepID=UPI002623D1E2|nr:CidA/LrgA family protein [Acaryochloris sp. IP29b_bin.148]